MCESKSCESKLYYCCVAASYVRASAVHLPCNGLVRHGKDSTANMRTKDAVVVVVITLTTN